MSSLVLSVVVERRPCCFDGGYCSSGFCDHALDLICEAECDELVRGRLLVIGRTPPDAKSVPCDSGRLICLCGDVRDSVGILKTRSVEEWDEPWSVDAHADASGEKTDVLDELGCFLGAWADTVVAGQVAVEIEGVFSLVSCESPVSLGICDFCTEGPEKGEIIDPSWSPESELVDMAVIVKVTGQVASEGSEFVHGPVGMGCGDGMGAEAFRSFDALWIPVDEKWASGNGQSCV